MASWCRAAIIVFFFVWYQKNVTIQARVVVAAERALEGVASRWPVGVENLHEFVQIVIHRALTLPRCIH
jgi:hypothetical protein